MADPEASEGHEREGDPPSDERVPFTSSFTVERAFRVNGKHIVVQAVVPAAAAKEIGMEASLQVAQRLLLRVESKEARVEEIRRG